MVSALWKACATGDAAQVAELLREATSVDIEVKDHTGVTPLIQAIRHGHVAVVKILLDYGADPSNASSSGRPENYTSDPAILELLAVAVAKNAQGAPVQQNGPAASNPPAPYATAYAPEGYAPYDPSHDGAPKGYYGPPVPMPYAQYYAPQPADGSAPPQNGPPPVAYYPLPPPGAGPPQGPQPEQSADGAQGNGGNNNLPPPHVARAIPCRYYPACRYGAACMFLHPQTPYFQGPMPPPAQYPPQFEPMSPQSAYPQAYYPVPPGVYPPPPGAVMGSPALNAHSTSPRPFVQAHSRAASEMVSPLGHAVALPPVHMVPYGMPAPMSPYAAQHGLPPMGMVHGPPPPHMGSPPVMASPQMFPSSAPMMPAQLPPMSPYHTRRDSITSYQAGFASPVMSAGDPSFVPKSPLQVQASMDGYPGGPHHSRDGSGHRGHRGGRPSMGGGGRGKPPCLFFPSGRCRNGDECRFPHVMPDGPAPPGAPPARLHKSSRVSMGSIESKLANLGLRDDASATNGHRVNGFGENGRGGFAGGRGGARRSPPARAQRVPVAEDFPVLSGSRTPPLGTNGHVNGSVTPNGPTAAQVLRAPAPVQKDQTRSPAPSETPKVDGEAAPTALAASLDAPTPEVPVSA